MAVSDSERRLSDVHLVMTGRMDVHKIRGIMRGSYVHTICTITQFQSWVIHREAIIVWFLEKFLQCPFSKIHGDPLHGQPVNFYISKPFLVRSCVITAFFDRGRSVGLFLRTLYTTLSTLVVVPHIHHPTM